MRFIQSKEIYHEHQEDSFVHNDHSLNRWFVRCRAIGPGRGEIRQRPTPPRVLQGPLLAAEVMTKRTMPIEVQLNTINPLHPSYVAPHFAGSKWVPTGEVSTAPYRDANNPLQPNYKRN